MSQDILNLYQEPDGTRKLLNYMLDNLAGTNYFAGFFFLGTDLDFFIFSTANLDIALKLGANVQLFSS